MTYLLILFAALLNACGSIFLKLATQRVPELLSLAQLTNPWLYLSLACFAANIAGYGLVLKKVPLAIGYPIYIGLTLAIVLAASYFAFNERLGAIQIAGIVLIFVGIVLASR